MKTNLADRYGVLQARKAELAAEEKTLRAALMATGACEFEGDLFDVAYGPCASRETLSMERAKKFLTPALLSQITTMSAPSVRWRISARKAVLAA